MCDDDLLPPTAAFTAGERYALLMVIGELPNAERTFSIVFANSDRFAMISAGGEFSIPVVVLVSSASVKLGDSLKISPL
jgi:hypothetical protein